MQREKRKEKKRKERNMYQFPSPAAHARMNAMRNNILEELLKHVMVIRTDTENPTFYISCNLAFFLHEGRSPYRNRVLKN